MPNNLDVHISDVARAEPLPGPQGTLFGSSSMAGTLRIITNKASTVRFEAGYDLDANLMPARSPGGSIEGYLNLPLLRDSAVRLVEFAEHDSGEPHFLLNTLATIHALARTERSAAIQLIDKFMQYLAAALPKLRHEETVLADEMRLIDAYLGIYQLRMGRRLSYQIALPPELATRRVFTMILLTLVENALKHGVNPAIEGGMIRVSAAREHSVLVLRVADSGRNMQSQQGQGSSLANARLSLMMRYGDEASLSLAPAEPRGVVATVRIPMSTTA